MEHPSLYTIEEIFGNKANSTIRMYAIKIVSNFFHLIFHFTVKICFLSLLLNCFASIHFFVTHWEKTFDRSRKRVCRVKDFFETPWWIPISSCDITKAKSRLSGLQTTHGKSGKLKKIHRLIFMLCIKVRLKILFYRKIIVFEVTETFLSPGN